MQVHHLCQAMSEIAPLRLAEDWDNVGLLLGHRSAPAARVMTCLTVTSAVVSEAEDENVDLIIAHHPLPFKPMGKINTDSAAGELVWRLCRAGTALYSAHTAYDSAVGGINDQWCEALGLSGGKPLIPQTTSHPIEARTVKEGGTGEETAAIGAGRFGDLPEARPASEILAAAAEFSGATRPRMVGDPHRPIRRIGVACGSGGSFVGAARRVGCDLLLTGEATFHTCLEAENTSLSLALVGHYASERFAMESLARRLQTLPDSLKPKARMANEAGLEVWASRREHDVIAVDPVSQNP
ncbi:Nif3-like dinuclear metal center hexameric protein [Rhodopirellula sp. SWK7]|uniref:Nif3-like dinuclear metal center hexameric protein n=1 Tax=Rhodopirellula sp. SWK7 TaxID=595460 RepID=UPI0002BE8161|nr:Nif3-like dinuclear metal center hexameric protein [Rhodopirellula sp. SWK7]EMI41426.1 NGG1p interacting factor 3, NIF3 [Rhodopirellula sp. SWK7]